MNLERRSAPDPRHLFFIGRSESIHRANIQIDLAAPLQCLPSRASTPPGWRTDGPANFPEEISETVPVLVVRVRGLVKRKDPPRLAR